MLTIALSKGRILDDTLPLLAEAGIVPTENPDKSRKLIIPTTQDDVRLLIVRATDVPTYVEHGAADLGVAGKDVLMEYGGQGLYEPLDLQIAKCKLMTAGAVGAPEPKGRLRVATKFVNVAKRYYAEQGRQVDIIALRLDGAGAADQPRRQDHRRGRHRQHLARQRPGASGTDRHDQLASGGQQSFHEDAARPHPEPDRHAARSGRIATPRLILYLLRAASAVAPVYPRHSHFSRVPARMDW